MPMPVRPSQYGVSHEDNAPESDYKIPRSACSRGVEPALPQFGCKPFACQIQECLDKHNFDQRQCAKDIDKLIACCRTLAKPGASLHCAGFMHAIRAAEAREAADAARQAAEATGAPE
ncbi:hypothetical protein FOA52_008594 [Chlamydomonas sp. UWO 241]|nr:hypothetical protein FOA52_008594 [Chlamydomonas sp. UWO 241]